MTQQPGWHAVALAGGVETGTSTGTHLFGEEVVVWRDATGAAHAWEDRCPHRGMRLSMGFVRSDRIACLYHGWQYGTDGHCLYIPAHPEISVPPTIVTWRHSCAEAIGMVWVHFGEAAGAPPIPTAVSGRDVVPVRSLYIDRPAEIVARRFARAGPPPFPSTSQGSATSRSVRRDGSLVAYSLSGEDLLIGAVHPMSDDRSALHLVIVGDAEHYGGAGQLHFSRFAEMLRDSIESTEPTPKSERFRRNTREEAIQKMAKTTDRAALDQWYCVDDVDDITATPRHTRLLGQAIVLRRAEGGAILCNEVLADGAMGADVPIRERFGYAWATLGTACPRRASDPRDRRARPALGEVRRRPGARVGAEDRRELPRHGAFPLRPHRHPRRRAAHRSPRTTRRRSAATSTRSGRPTASSSSRRPRWRRRKAS